MKSNQLHTFSWSLLSVAGLASVALSSFTPVHAGVVLPAVGPTPPGQYDRVSCGYLKVFSRTEQTQWGEGSFYYPHTGYRILDAEGKTVKFVENHNTKIDEAPQKVELEPGTYTVKAWSDDDGLVTVPVVIKLAKTTSVHLEEGRESDRPSVKPSNAVVTPSGQVVGWKA